MTTATAPTPVDADRDEVEQLRAQVGRLQNFAFRDLISASQEELAQALAALTAEQRQVLQRMLAGNPTTPTFVDDRQSRRNQWRRNVGLLDPSDAVQATS